MNLNWSIEQLQSSTINAYVVKKYDEEEKTVARKTCNRKRGVNNTEEGKVYKNTLKDFSKKRLAKPKRDRTELLLFNSKLSTNGKTYQVLAKQKYFTVVEFQEQLE